MRTATKQGKRWQMAGKAAQFGKGKKKPFVKLGGPGGGGRGGRTQSDDGGKKIASVRNKTKELLRQFEKGSAQQKDQACDQLAQIKSLYGDQLGTDLLGQIDSALAYSGGGTSPGTVTGEEWYDPNTGAPIVDPYGGGGDPYSDAYGGGDPYGGDPYGGGSGSNKLEEMLLKMQQLDSVMGMKGKGKKAAKQIWKNVRLYMGDVNRASRGSKQTVLSDEAQGSFGKSRQVGPGAAGAFGGSRLQSPDVGPQISPPLDELPFEDPYAMDPYGMDPYGPQGYADDGYAAGPVYGEDFGRDSDFYEGPAGYSSVPDSEYLVPEYAGGGDVPVPESPSTFAQMTKETTESGPYEISPSAQQAESGSLLTAPGGASIDYGSNSIDSSPGLDDAEMEEVKGLIGEQLGDLADVVANDLTPALQNLQYAAAASGHPELQRRARGAEYAVRLARAKVAHGLADYSFVDEAGLEGLGSMAAKALTSLGAGAVLTGTIAAVIAGGLLVDFMGNRETKVLAGAGNGVLGAAAVTLPILAIGWGLSKLGKKR